MQLKRLLDALWDLVNFNKVDIFMPLSYKHTTYLLSSRRYRTRTTSLFYHFYMYLNKSKFKNYHLPKTHLAREQFSFLLIVCQREKKRIISFVINCFLFSNTQKQHILHFSLSLLSTSCVERLEQRKQLIHKVWYRESVNYATTLCVALSKSY